MKRAFAMVTPQSVWRLRSVFARRELKTRRSLYLDHPSEGIVQATQLCPLTL